MRVSVASDVGRVRAGNEDNYCVIDLRPAWEGDLYAVADGMGGYEAGEVASALAVLTLVDRVREGMSADPQADPEDVLRDAVFGADLAIFAEAQRRGVSGMGTTLTVALVGRGKVRWAHVGDSRAYLLGRGGMLQLTDDHSLVGEMLRTGSLSEHEAMVHPQRNILTNALGTGGLSRVDTGCTEAAADDLLVLCTDGLTNLVTKEEIQARLADRSDLDGAARRLTELANERGGHDNITVLVVELS